jgi:hypothetical protein
MSYEKFLGPLLQHLMTNPTALQDGIMSHYTMSPTAQYQMKTTTNQLNRAAAMGGNLGTPNEQQAMAGTVNGIVSGDQQQYLDNAMRPYQMGLQGLTGLTQLGANAGGQIANMYGDLYSNEAQMDASQNAQGQNLLGGLIGLAGGALGGPIGSAIGSGIGHMFGSSGSASAPTGNFGGGMTPQVQSYFSNLFPNQGF